MPSPFPGMNPYLQQSSVWTDFHNRFIATLSEFIAARVAPAYYVRIEEQLYVHEWPSPFARADVSVSERSKSEPRGGGGATTLSAPLELTDPVPTVDHERIPYLEVVSRDDRRVVTVIELLSPTNKYAGADRSALLNRAIHYLEVDLLRGGPRMPIRELPDCDYYVYLSRFHRRPQVEFWPLRLRDQLPLVPVPLLPDDEDARVDLQDLLNTVYDRARYEFSIYDDQQERHCRRKTLRGPPNSFLSAPDRFASPDCTAA